MTNQELYNSLFQYDNGRLIRKVTVAPNAQKNDLAGSIMLDKPTGRQYYIVGINSKQMLLHRVIWIMHFGDIPEGFFIDHIYHDTLDNRIENLRLVTHQENDRNKNKYKTNTSGHANIYIHKDSRKNKFKVEFRSFNYNKCFLTLEEAIQHRNEKYIEFGFHENHGL